jgi:hypothetical protein
MPVVRAPLLRVSVITAALVLLMVSSAGAQGDHRDDPPVILFAAVSADGATLSVSGTNFPSEPFVTLGGMLLGGVAVVRQSDVDRLTALMPALLPGSCRLRLYDRVPGGDEEDAGMLVSFDVGIGVAGTRTATATGKSCDGECSSEQPPAN